MARTKSFNETAVLDRAVDLFRRKGYQGTSPAQLVDYLGISRSSLYDTYGDKRTLFMKSLQRYRQQTSAVIKALVDRATDVRVTMGEIFEFTLNNCLEDDMPKGCFLVNSIAELPSEEKDILTIVNESMLDNRNAFIRLIKKGQRNGQLPLSAKPAELADYFVNCLCGLSITARAGGSRRTCEAIIRNSISVLFPVHNNSTIPL